MPDAINQAFVNQYSTTLHMLVQQQGSRLLQTTRREPVVGEAAYFERLGPFTANEYTDREGVGVRHQATPVDDTPHTKRLCAPIDYDWGTLVDHFDKLRMLIDPMSAYNRNARYAIGRKIDSEIIAAGTRDALDKAGATVALGAAQALSTGAGGIGSGALIDLDVILAVEEKFNSDEVPAEGRIWVLDSAAWRQLKAIPEVNNADFNTQKVLAGDGAIDPYSIRFNGFQFIRTELITTGKSLIYQQDGILFGEWSNIIAEIAKDPTVKYSWRPYFAMTGGAVRMEEERVIDLTIEA